MRRNYYLIEKSDIKKLLLILLLEKALRFEETKKFG